MKHTGKTLAAFLLSLVMALGLVPGMSLTALAWDGDPYASLLNTTTVVKLDNKEWYLIENNSTAVNAGTVTLLSKRCVAVSQFNSNGFSNTYSGSTVESAVKNYYDNSISSNVKSAIVDSKMFLLTKKQANAMTTDTRKCSWASEESRWWWLCSVGEHVHDAACVNCEYGEVNAYGFVVGKTCGVRPALKLNLESVIFSSESNTFTVVSAKETQTISASDVTATFGDTGKKIEAGTTGDGTLSYAVKSGDAVTVDGNGALTIVKVGTATVTVTASETETYAQATKDVNVTVNAKAMTVSAENVNVTVDGQAHGITVNVTDPATGYAVKYGTEEGNYTLDTSPTQTEMGEKTVYYQVTANNYTTYTGSAKVTVSAKQTQTITANDVTVTYGDADKKVTATTNGNGAISYAVKEGSADYIDVDSTTGALTIKKVGTATVVVTAAETSTYSQATKEVTVTINKASAVAATVTANNRTYDGTEKPLVTVTGEATGGEMQFALGTATEAAQPYTTSIPTATDAGTYYVWYMVKGDSNHKDTDPTCVTAAIISNTVTYNTVSGAGQDHLRGSGQDAVFTIKGTPEDNAYEAMTQVRVNRAILLESSYGKAKGSLILTLRSRYLDTLPTGRQALSVFFRNGQELEIPFTVSEKQEEEKPEEDVPKPEDGGKPAKNVPKTGDGGNPMLWLGMLLAGAGLILLAARQLKRKMR